SYTLSLHDALPILAGQLDVRAAPEVLEVLTLLEVLGLEARATHPVERAAAAVEQLSMGHGAGGVVGHRLADGEGLALLQMGADHLAAHVRAGVHELLDLGIGVHLMVRAERATR